MSRARENADGARLDAPKASPALTGVIWPEKPQIIITTTDNNSTFMNKGK